jgi:hypothetical protein
MYFHTFTTVEEIKAEYRRLAKIHHPDLGGDLRTMQDINVEYHKTLNKFDGTTSTGTDGQEHTYRYNQQTEQEVMDKLAELLKVKGNLEIWLIGQWLWVNGDTKPVKETLKELGCRWHSKRVCWYWRPEGYRHFGKHSDDALDQLAAKYGASRFTASAAGTAIR